MKRLKQITVATGLALVLANTALAQQTLNVRDADIRAFIQDAARVTGKTFIIDNRVQGKVSVVTDRPLSKSEYFEIFLSTLRANGLVAVQAPGGAYRVQPVEGAAGQPSSVGTAANRNQFVTEVFRLRATDATSALETLRPLVSKDGSVTANRAGNSIVVADYADNVARIRQVIARIDRDSATIETVTLANAGAREVAASLQALVGATQAGTPSAATIVAVDSSNSILLRGDPVTIARLAAVARDLDRKAASGTEIRVYWLEHDDAEKLMPTLQQILGQATTAPSSSSSASSGGASVNASPAGSATPVSAPSAPVQVGPTGAGITTRGPAIVTRYEGANALIIAANSDVQRQLGEVIRQLDTRREQVLVEAIIVEIGDSAAQKLGVQFLLGSTNTGFAVTNYSNATPNILTIGGAIGATQLNKTTTVINGSTVTTSESSQLGETLQQAAISSLMSATGGIAGVATKLGNNGIFGAIINAVKSDTDSNLLSTPSVMTLDNHKAFFLVGQQVPVTTGQALSQNFDNQFRTVQRQDVGVKLEVLPQINSGGAVKLYLKQEVSSVAGPVSNNDSDLIINKRELETTVTIDDGEILALGGLLDDNERRTIEKIPFLGDLPGIGALFRSKSKSRAKTNLMIFIRPTIIRDRTDAATLTAQRYDYIRGRQLDMNPSLEPSLDALVRDYMAAVPPGADQVHPGDQVIDGRVSQVPTTSSSTVVTPVVPAPKP